MTSTATSGGVGLPVTVLASFGRLSAGIGWNF
jgi:hypothetical protein